MATNNSDYFEYRIKNGDTLSLIIFRMFGAVPQDQRYKKIINHLLALNPQIKDVNRIRAGDILRLGVLPSPQKVNPMPAKLPQEVISGILQKPKPFFIGNVPPQDMENFWLLSWMAQNSNYLTIPGGIALGAQDNLLNQANIKLITQINDYYADFKAGKLTRNQYNYLRKKALDQLRLNIGPLEKLLYGKRTPHEVIRIARGGGVPTGAVITKQADRLARLASIGKNGGYVLAGVGVVASCMQIADAQDHAEKNEIFVETVASTSIGLASGALIGLFLVSNPIGWGTALVLAAGSAAISYAAGKGARKAYKLSGTEVDFVSGFGIDSVCR